MALEDLTTYTETDVVEDRLTVTSTKVDCVAGEYNENLAVFKDFSAGYFGDFVVRFKFTWVSYVSNASVNFFCMTNGLNFNTTEQDAADDGIALRMNQNGGVIMIIQHDYTNNTFDFATGYADTGFTRWFEIERSGTTLTTKIYTDAYSTLEDTLTDTVSAETYRYLAVFSGYLVGVPDGNTTTAFVEDYEIGPFGGAILKVGTATYAGASKVGGVAVAGISKIGTVAD